MKITHEELQEVAIRLNEKNVASTRVVEELMREVNGYRQKVDEAYNFTGGHEDLGVYNGLFRTGIALVGLSLVPYDNVAHYPSWWQTYVDCSVEPYERYWIVPSKDFVKYI